MYFVKRLIGIVPLLILISMLAFVLVHVAPGGPFDKERVPPSPEIKRAIEAKYHLDEPLWKQYLRYVGLLWVKDKDGWHRTEGGLVVLDFGPSFKYRNHTVNDIIYQGLPISMMLGLLAFGFALGTGIPLGFYTAVHRGKWADYGGSFFAILAICIPGFVIGPLLILWLSIRWQLLPSALWGTPSHFILPAVSLGLYFAGRVSRLMREGMSQTLQEHYITTARAKGLGEFDILIKHAFRLAVLPVVSYSGPLLADLLTGSFVVESIFRIPGIGVFLVNSSLNRDYPMVVGLVVLYAFLLVMLNLVVDFAYSFLDRRVRYE